MSHTSYWWCSQSLNKLSYRKCVIQLNATGNDWMKWHGWLVFIIKVNINLFLKLTLGYSVLCLIISVQWLLITIVQINFLSSTSIAQSPKTAPLLLEAKRFKHVLFFIIIILCTAQLGNAKCWQMCFQFKTGATDAKCWQMCFKFKKKSAQLVLVGWLVRLVFKGRLFKLV